MAEHASDERKQELIRELDQARSRSRAARAKLSETLRYGARFKAHLKRNRAAYLTGAVLVGIVIAKIPARTRKVVVDWRGKEKKEVKAAGMAGLALAAVKLAFDLSKPFLTKWAKARMEKAAANGR